MSKIVPVQPPTDRMIVTTYYVDGRRLESTKVIRSKYPRLAVMRAMDNMSMNFYDAQVCVVYDEEWGKDHATIKRTVDDEITIIYGRDPSYWKIAQTGSFKLKKTKSAEAREKRQAKKVISVPETITVGDLAKLLGKRPAAVSKALLERDITATIGQMLDQELAMMVVTDLGFIPGKETKKGRK